MTILNYTTTISTEKTVGEIQRMLSRAGARAVLTEFDSDGTLSAVSFRMPYENTMISFRLPARIDNIYVLLQNDGNPNVRPKHRNRDQAARVAWRIIKDWIEAQLAIVSAEQAEMVEVFLPYAQDPTGKTVFERLSGSNFTMLLEHDRKS